MKERMLHSTDHAAWPLFALQSLILVWFGPYAVTWPLLMVCFGAMIVVPLGLETIQRHGIGIQLHHLLFILAGIGMAISNYSGYSLTALPWLLVTLWIAWQAVMQFSRGPRTLARTVTLSGPAMLAVGGAWYFADIAGLEPFGFDFLIVRLTAAHFHFAGFALPIAAGLALMHWPNLLLKVAAVGVMAGVPLVATGITLTRMGVRVEVECCLALAFSICALAVGIAQAALAWKAVSQSTATRAMLFVSGCSLTAGMTLAILYALRPWVPLPWLHLPAMWAWHGSIQVFGFALCGLIGWHGWRMESGTPTPCRTALPAE